jgi:cobalamin biosynthesis Mg chelatase CobN
MHILKALLLAVSFLLLETTAAHQADRDPSSKDEEGKQAIEAAAATEAKERVPEASGDFQRVDPRIYEGAVPDQSLNQSARSTYVPPARVPVADVFKGSALLAEGEANRKAAARVEASTGPYPGTVMSRESAALIGVAIVVAMVFWGWLGSSARTRTRVTVWTVRATVLAGSFYVHWAFGLFMLFGLYTHATRFNGR